MERTKKWRTFSTVALSSLLLLLTACGNKPPKCGDEDVTALVLQVYKQAVEKEAATMSEERLSRFRYTEKESKATIETITVQSVDEKASKATCQGTLRIRVPEAAIAAISDQAKQHLNAKFDVVGAY